MKPLYNYWECFKVLPAVYDESLSYYEVLAKLTNAINDLIKRADESNNELYAYINSRDNYVLNYSKQYTDDTIRELKNELNFSLSELLMKINSNNDYLKTYISGELSLIKNWVSEQGHSIFVINPISGKLDSIQNVLNSYYNLFNYESLSCIEYDTLGLTCDDYDGYNLTCLMYDYHGKKYLWSNNELLMFHPVTGEKTFYKNVIDFLVELHRENGLTCTEYDALDLSTADYNNQNIDCYNYDWNSKTILI